MCGESMRVCMYVCEVCVSVRACVRARSLVCMPECVCECANIFNYLMQRCLGALRAAEEIFTHNGIARKELLRWHLI